MHATVLTLSILLAARGPVVIKLATLAPRGSAYADILEQLARDWRDASGGGVQVRLYLDGVAGSEGDMVRKMGVGEIQAASLTTVGMHDIAPEPQALDTPGLIRTADEFDFVLPRVEPLLDAALAAKGFVALGWADVGTARFFSTFPLRAPSDAHGARIYCWQGDPEVARAWERIGFSPVVLAPSDISASLQTGMINAVTEPPLFTFVARTFEKANHMLDFDWSILSGATVVRAATWQRIPEDLRPVLARIATAAAARMSIQAREMNAQAVREMEAQGLVVDEPSSRADWEALAAQTWPSLRGSVVPAGFFDRIRTLVEAFRGAQAR